MRYLRNILFIAAMVTIATVAASAQATGSLVVARDGRPIGQNDLVQLGNATAGQTDIVIEFSVTNTGSSDVSLSTKAGAIIKGDTSEAFTVVMQPVPLLHPGDRFYFRIEYRPKHPGPSFATVALVGDDQNRPLYWFYIQALASPAPNGAG